LLLQVGVFIYLLDFVQRCLVNRLRETNISKKKFLYEVNIDQA